MKKTKFTTMALILVLTTSIFLTITPTLALVEDVSIDRFTWGYETIGVNQLQSLGVTLDPSLTRLKSIQEEDLIYNAYLKLIKPDGTTYNIDGPFYIDKIYSQYITIEFTPDQAGTWTAEFHWAGEPGYYNPAFRDGTFTVTETPVDIMRDVEPWLFFRPDIIGIGQPLLVEMGVVPRPKLPGDVYHGYNVKFTKPDGTTDTIGPMSSYPDSTQWFEYTPDQAGTWTVQFLWDGGKYEAPQSTQVKTFTVQAEPVPYWPAAPLPTEPWDYPINVFSREWYQISGPWFLNTGRENYDSSRSAYNPYSKAPRSPHILWSLSPSEGVGGMVGGPYGSGIYYDESSIEFKAVMAGRGYWQGGGQIHCVDIRSGEELWAVEGAFDFGSIEVPSQTSAQPILVSITSPRGRLIKFDALTGEKILDVPGFTGTRATSRRLFDPLGGYIVDVDPTRPPQFILKYTFFGDTDIFEDRVVWNVTFPFEGIDTWNMILMLDFEADAIVNLTYDIYSDGGGIDYTTGELLWQRVIPSIQSRHSSGMGFGNAYHTLDGRIIRAIDARTGEVAWDTEQMEEPWGNYWAYSHSAAYNNIYKLGYAGLHCIDTDTGELLWVFTAGDAGYETPYGSWPFYDRSAIADGVVFAGTSEHSPTIPVYRGQKLFAIDAFEGTEIWHLESNIEPYIVAEGILFGIDLYDGRSYAFGKGETVTTLSVSDEVIAKGSSVLLKGTVLDQSPAQQGTAAIADEYMTSWMEYLHLQQPKPMDVKGVQVVFTVVDSNNNCYEIGRTTSSITGQYSFLWEPEIPGEFQITATFAGSESYYASSAETVLGVTESPSPGQQMEPELVDSRATSPEAITPEATIPTEAPLITTEIAILLAAIIVAVAIVAGFWITKKRK